MSAEMVRMWMDGNIILYLSTCQVQFRLFYNNRKRLTRWQKRLFTKAMLLSVIEGAVLSFLGTLPYDYLICSVWVFFVFVITRKVYFRLSIGLV